MKNNQKIEIIERHIKIDGKVINDGDYVTFKYGKKENTFNGYFYITDIANMLLAGADFLITDKKRNKWKWYDGYLRGFNFNRDKIKGFKVINNAP